jgi:hypothetical protein
MKMSSAITDNITEVLNKIGEFTRRRREIIAENILNVNMPGYEPKDLNAGEFANLMAQAISEHIQNSRLMLCDGRTIRFGANGSFEAEPVVDAKAARLLASDSKSYLLHQFEKLTETLVNNQVAGALLVKKERATSAPRFFQGS